MKDVLFGTKLELELRKQQRNFSIQTDSVDIPELKFETVSTNSS